MNATRWTAGPWKVSGRSGALMIEGGEHGVLASVRYLGNSRKRVAEEEANARFIAAAPELVEVLTALLDEADAYLDYHTDDEDMQRDADAARTLLARIRGDA